MWAGSEASWPRPRPYHIHLIWSQEGMNAAETPREAARPTLKPMRPPSEMVSLASPHGPLLAPAPNSLPRRAPQVVAEAMNMLVLGEGLRWRAARYPAPPPTAPPTHS